MKQLLICNHTHYIEKNLEIYQRYCRTNFLEKKKKCNFTGTSLILYTIFITFVVKSNNEFKGFNDSMLHFLAFD